jgi:hypothetical protein
LRRTFSTEIRNPPSRRLQRVDPAVRRGDAQAAADIAANPRGGAVHREERRLAARATAAGVGFVPRVRRAAPHGVRAFKSEHGLRDVGLDVDDGACGEEGVHDLAYAKGGPGWYIVVGI